MMFMRGHSVLQAVWTANGANEYEGREREIAGVWPGSRWFAVVRGFVVQMARASRQL